MLKESKLSQIHEAKEGAAVKHPRRLTKHEKIMLDDLGFNPADFLRTKRTPEGYEFLQRSTGRIMSVRG